MSLWDAEPVPSRVVGLVHTALYLESENDGRVVRDELEGWCAPQALTGREDHRGFGEIFAECRKLNLLVEHDDPAVFRVHPTIRAAVTFTRRRDIADYRCTEILAGAVRAAVLVHLAQKPSPDPSFCRILAWFLMQRGSDYPLSKEAAEHLANRQDPDRSVIGFNDVRHGSAIYWISFLGFGWQQSTEGAVGPVDVLQPDPSQALTHILALWADEPASALGVGRLTPISDFLRRVAEIYPWMEEGDIARGVYMGLSEPPVPPEQHVRDATSLALLRMQRRGVIRLHHPSDAEARQRVWQLGWGGPKDEVSHIEWLGKRSLS